MMAILYSIPELHVGREELSGGQREHDEESEAVVIFGGRRVCVYWPVSGKSISE